jgi:hypothetical protein
MVIMDEELRKRIRVAEVEEGLSEERLKRKKA